MKFDNRDTLKPGFKFAEWELKGVPLRLAIGMRDIQNNTIEIARRDTKEKKSISMDGIVSEVNILLNDFQQNLYSKANSFKLSKTKNVNSKEEFLQVMDEGGFALAHWDGSSETEEKIKEEYKATIRCIPLNNLQEEGICFYTGLPSKERVVFARAY